MNIIRIRNLNVIISLNILYTAGVLDSKIDGKSLLDVSMSAH